MRVPLIPNISTKDGEANKNARMTNCLVETTKTGSQFAVLRPSLVADATISGGSGNGLVSYDNKLISIYGANLDEVIPGDGNNDPVFLNFLDGLVTYTEAVASGISLDGTIISGYYKNGGTWKGFLWNVSSGFTDLGAVVVNKDTLPLFLSTDGSSVIGRFTDASGFSRAFKWTSGTGLVEILGIGYNLVDANADNTVLVGYTTSSDMFIWTEGSGVITVSRGVYDLVQPIQVSADGTTVVGRVYSGAYTYAFRWTSATGVVLLSAYASRAFGCSEDGTVVAGIFSQSDDIGFGSTDIQLFRWTLAGGSVAIANPAWSVSPTPFVGNLVGGRYKGLTADGSMIVAATRYFGGEYISIAWTELDGIYRISEEYSLPSAMSGDGTYIASYTAENNNDGVFYENLGTPSEMAMGLIAEAGLAASIYRLSDNGVVVGGSASNIPFKWIARPQRTLPIATLSDRFYDFTQSTL